MKKLSLALIVLILLASCHAKRGWEKQSVESKEKLVMEQAKTGKVDTTAVNELLSAYETYAKNFPGDTLGANYLFRAADFYKYLRKPMRSIALYEKIYNEYPTFIKRPYSLFLQGFIFENEVHNLDSASAKYHQFLAAFPNHPIAKDVAITLANLGKTPDQLMQEFEAKQQADSLALSSK